MLNTIFLGKSLSFRAWISQHGALIFLRLTQRRLARIELVECLCVSRMRLYLLQVNSVFDVVTSVSKHRVGLTSTRLSIHEDCPIDTVEWTQTYLSTTVLIHLLILLICIEATIVCVGLSCQERSLLLRLLLRRVAISCVEWRDHLGFCLRISFLEVQWLPSHNTRIECWWWAEPESWRSLWRSSTFVKRTLALS